MKNIIKKNPKDFDILNNEFQKLKLGDDPNNFINTYSKITGWQGFELGFELIDINHKKQTVVLKCNRSKHTVKFTFDYWNDVNRYITGEWDWKTKSINKNYIKFQKKN